MPYQYNPYADRKTCLNCKEKDFCLDWNKFVQKQSDPETRSKYAHFDSRRYLNDPKVLKNIMNPHYVKSHGFYPLIRYWDKGAPYPEENKGEKEDKEDKEGRPISYCGYLDRAIYQRYSFILNYYYNRKVEELGIAKIPIAYRTNLKGQSNINFAKEAFDFISNQEKAYILVGDFKGFFKTLNHKYLKQMLCKTQGVRYLSDDMYAVFKNITRYSCWEWKDLLKVNGLDRSRGATTTMNQKSTIITRDQFRRNSHMIKTNSHSDGNWKEYGIPQGTPISAVLSNVYMLDFDRLVNSVVKELGGKYMRYSDDLIIIIPETSEEKIDELKEYIFHLIETIDKKSQECVGLKINDNKTQEYLFDGEYIKNFADGKIAYLDYLGFIYNGKKIKVRRKAITKYYYRMYKKAKTIKNSNGVTHKGNPISMQNLYETYSERRKKKRNFIDYLKSADDILGLDDSQAKSLIDNHMEKIAKAVKWTPR